MNIVFCKSDSRQMDRYAAMTERFCEEHHKEASIHKYNSIDQMLFGISESEFQIDLIIMDVQVEGQAGTEVIERIRKQNFDGEVIFLTSNAKKWSLGYDIQAFHYVLENECNRETFETILGNVFKKIEKREQESVAFFCAGRRIVVAVRDIEYFEVKGRWIWVFYRDKSFEFFGRLGKVEQALMGKGFIRPHRSYLVAIQHISSIRYEALTMLNGKELPIARGKYQEVKAQFERMHMGEEGLL